MICLKIKSYTPENCVVLYDALIKAYENIRCSNYNGDCQKCANRLPCNDLYETLQYLEREMGCNP